MPTHSCVGFFLCRQAQITHACVVKQTEHANLLRGGPEFRSWAVIARGWLKSEKMTQAGAPHQREV